MLLLSFLRAKIKATTRKETATDFQKLASSQNHISAWKDPTSSEVERRRLYTCADSRLPL
jgi:hypothetical protein